MVSSPKPLNTYHDTIAKDTGEWVLSLHVLALRESLKPILLLKKLNKKCIYININSPLRSLMRQLLTWFSPFIFAWHWGKCEQTLKSGGLERRDTRLLLSGHTWYARHSTRQPTGLCCKFTHICPNLLARDRNGKTILGNAIKLINHKQT